MDVYDLIEPRGRRVPILISVPHCGTLFPDDIQSEFKEEAINSQDDTDWFVHKLYDFAPAMGMTMIQARYSRWVVDLNRDPGGQALYTDGRIITALCPATDFLGSTLYKDARSEVRASEVRRRTDLYFQPYHDKVQELLTAYLTEFGKVLLWDCHSIRQIVPSIQKEKFPDLILGDADGGSCSPDLISSVWALLGESEYDVQHNHPFKGGYITRQYGNPSRHQYALQLEMTKVNYMDDVQLQYDTVRADKMRKFLMNIFSQLIEKLT